MTKKVPYAGADLRPLRRCLSDKSLALVASESLPPHIAREFTPGEQAALAVVIAELKRCDLCDLPRRELAARSGMSPSVCESAVHKACMSGWLLSRRGLRELSKCYTAHITLASDTTPAREVRAWISGTDQRSPWSWARRRRGRGLGLSAAP